MNEAIAKPRAAVPRRVTEAEFYNDATTGERVLELRFECGHWEWLATLPKGFPSTESLCGALLGCTSCAAVEVAA